MIYLDNGSTSFPKAPGVGLAMASFVETWGANSGRGVYSSALRTDEMVETVRERLAKMLGFSHPDHVVFTKGATEGLNLVLRGFVSSGDKIAVTAFEHNSVVRTLYRLGAEMVVLPYDETGVTIPQLPQGVKAVVMTGVSNVSGMCQPIEEMGRLCKAAQIPLVVDGAQACGHVPIFMEQQGITALVVSGHKGLLGPQGIGAVLLMPDFAKRVSPLLTGGTGVMGQTLEMPPSSPERFEAGTQNLPGIAGWGCALEFIEQKTAPVLQLQEEAVGAYFLRGLKKIGGIRLLGKDAMEGRISLFSLDFMGQDNSMCAYQMEARYEIACRSGYHCAPQAHRALGTEKTGAVRFSFSCFTQQEEVEVLLEAVDKISTRASL